jgi:general secretion pathway protein K
MSGMRRLDPRRGVVLIAVLWTIALLSALAMAAAASFRSFAGVLAIDRDRVQADALLSAGMELGADLLAKYRNRPLAPSVSVQLTLSTGVVRVQLSDELGKIDVNKAPLEVFASLFSEVGVPNGADLARAIILWRDGEVKSAAERQRSKPTPQVSIAAAPGAAPKIDKPEEQRDFEQAFTNVEQLSQIPAMRPDYVRMIAPYTTVFGDETVNALTAPPEILRALPEMNDARIQRVLEARSVSPVDPARIEQILGPASLFVKPKTHSVARLELTAALADGFAAAAEAVIVILPKDQQPYRVLAFRQLPTAIGGRNF